MTLPISFPLLNLYAEIKVGNNKLNEKCLKMDIQSNISLVKKSVLAIRQ